MLVTKNRIFKKFRERKILIFVFNSIIMQPFALELVPFDAEWPCACYKTDLKSKLNLKMKLGTKPGDEI